MIATLVHVWVKKEKIEDFIEASVENHTESIKESGNLRFDILQDPENPSKFTFYEAYESDEAVAVHKKTSHYFKWRNTVADWMAKPREGIKHTVIAPTDKNLW
ncbi:MAG: antibiotic biosynthesis monooxygenase [Verrucomicrobiota bacterium]|nr:antibiotic biosynthesis monooxygenase [Verrucomicrobiota bacterium]